MKKLVTFLLLCFPICTQAQWNALVRQSGKITREVHPIQNLRGPSQAALRATTLRQLTPATQQFSQMERMVHTTVTATLENRRPVFSEPLCAGSDLHQYQETMNAFNKFKKEADVFLYYQAKPNEQHLLTPQEVRHWTDRILNIKYQLQKLTASGISQDQSLQQAYTYLNYVLKTVSPSAIPFTPPAQSYQAPNRIYKENEFFLHPPQILCWKQALRRLGISCGPVAQLPANLNIVIFNDVDFVLEKMEQQQRAGLLFPPDTKVVFLHSANEVRQYIIRLGNSPDLILADMNTALGLEGPALACDLRAHGYKGDILALTGFAQGSLNGDVLLQAGIDGSIARTSQGDTPFTGLVQAVKNYYYYRNLHGWQH